MLSMLLDSKKSVDAAVCYNDQIALAVISMLEEKGISVPEDIAVTGYDNSLIGQSSPIGITTIAHPQEKLGEMAAELILEKNQKSPGRRKQRQTPDFPGTHRKRIHRRKKYCQQRRKNRKEPKGGKNNGNGCKNSNPRTENSTWY